MNNRLKSLIILIYAILLLSGCDTENSNNTNIMQYFEKDMYTEKVNEMKVIENTVDTSNKELTDNDNGYDNTLAEITLIGNDNSIAYDIINETDVEYKGVVYKNLYTNINLLETNYDKNTLINFIIKTYKAKSSTIYTIVYKDTLEGENSDIEAITIDEMLSESEQYNITKNKYGEAASWMMQLIDSETRQEVEMCGSTSYILITSDGVSKEIDMTEYDSGINRNNRDIETTETDIETTETDIETTETDIETTETEGDNLNET